MSPVNGDQMLLDQIVPHRLVRDTLHTLRLDDTDFLDEDQISMRIQIKPISCIIRR